MNGCLESVSKGLGEGGEWILRLEIARKTREMGPGSYAVAEGGGRQHVSEELLGRTLRNFGIW
ncbi:hypothetical protein PISMIDRAFT_19110 [Pisolithus microcarpus 441]|uniref:Uncharacterized protein n=1 Tax=Pisolithus microcarpus 441 TaxID=765257 RepID=A0A0C9XI25_9AGAM|nr:hypothetical protein PISMIDRAFT_19110 [Pisolithus microcarpus 441]